MIKKMDKTRRNINKNILIYAVLIWCINMKDRWTFRGLMMPTNRKKKLNIEKKILSIIVIYV